MWETMGSGRDGGLTIVLADHMETLRVAQDLQRSSIPATLVIDSGCSQLANNVFESLASGDRKSSLRSIVLLGDPNNWDTSSLQFSPPVDTSTLQYLASATCAVKTLEFKHLPFKEVNGIIRSLGQNTMVENVDFNHCRIGPEDADEFIKAFSEFLEHTTTLQELLLQIVHDGMFPYMQATQVLCTFLEKRGSPLRRLLVDFGGAPIDAERSLVKAIPRSALTKLYIVPNKDGLDTLLGAMPSFRIKDYTLDAEGGPQLNKGNTEGEILAAIKRNYHFTNVTVRGIGWRNTPQNQTSIQRCLNRNTQMWAWTEDPALVPRRLWPVAVAMARSAGVDPLYRALVKLARQGVRFGNCSDESATQS